MIQPDTLRTLAAMTGPERAFLSIYLSGSDAVAGLDHRFRDIRALLAEQPDELAHFEENLRLALPLVEGHHWGEAPALVVFACWANDFVQAMGLPVALGDRAWVGDAPYVRPLAELLDEHEAFAVAVVDAKSARVFLVTAEEAEQAARVRGDVKNRVRVGGWSQKRYARRREKEMAHYAGDVVDALVGLSEESAFSRLVLLGADEAVRAVRERLTPPLAEKLAGTGALDGRATDGETLEKAAAVATEGERADEARLWEEIREQALVGGLAVLGATRVLEAVDQARVEVILVDRTAEINGTKCRACEHVVHGTPQTCQRCGARDVFHVDLVEALVERAARTGADVDFTEPSEALTEAGHVAALLRY